MDIRMKTLPMELEGERYELLCNMNVLAELQERAGGDLVGFLESKNVLRSLLVILSVMINEAAEKSGRPKRYTDRELGRMLSYQQAIALKGGVMELITAAITEEDAEETPQTDEKNGQTTRAEQTA